MLKANEIIVEPGNAIIKKKPASYFENNVLEILKDCDTLKYLGFSIDSSKEWKGANTKLVLECSKHGVYDTCSYNNFFKGRRCRLCRIEKQTLDQTMSQEMFIERGISIHGEKYDYTNVNYVNAHVKVQLTCNDCYTEFKISPAKHIHHGQGCRKCCKFGITYDVEKRMSQQKCGSKFEHELIYTEYFENGMDAVLLETKIKNTLNCSVLNKDDFPDGYTETIYSKDFEVLMGMVMTFVQK